MVAVAVTVVVRVTVAAVGVVAAAIAHQMQFNTAAGASEPLLPFALQQTAERS
jgi:hypothetical protein